MPRVWTKDTGGTLSTSLISYWDMQGNSNDVKGSNNGTDTAMTYGNTYGEHSQGADFVIANSSKIKATVSSGFSGSFSINLWLNPQTAQATHQFFMMSYVSSYNNYWWSIADDGGGGFNFSLYDGTNNPVTSTSGFSTGSWYMVTA